MKGSIHPLENKPRNRCRKWQLRISMPYDKTKKRYPQKTKVIQGTITEAEKELDTFRAEISRPQLKGSWTVSEYIDHWIKLREASGNYAKRTTDGERHKLKSIKMHLGNSNLNDVTAADIEDAYVRLRGGESLSGRCLSGKTLSDIHKTFTSMMKHAHRHDAIASNPIEKVDAPKQDTKEKKALSDKDVKSLMRKLDTRNAYDVALLLCITCGLRRSEALAVSWDDFNGSTLDITKSVEEDSSIKSVKTSSGIRRIPLPESTIVSLWLRKKSQHNDMGSRGLEQTSFTPIVSTSEGKRLLPHSFTAWWRKNRSRYGLDGFSIHELRHTYLTMLARQGVHPKVMQELAGHSTIDTTMQIYSHVNIEQKIIAVGSLDGILG